MPFIRYGPPFQVAGVVSVFSILFLDTIESFMRVLFGDLMKKEYVVCLAGDRFVVACP